MTKSDTIKMLCLKIHNKTRSCVLLRQYPNYVWTLPVIEISEEADPYYYIDEALGQIKTSDDFQLISAVSILETTQVPEDKPSEFYKSVIYEIGYKGEVYPELPKGCYKTYSKSQWVTMEGLKSFGSLNYPTRAFVDILKENECMK